MPLKNVTKNMYQMFWEKELSFIIYLFRGLFYGSTRNSVSIKIDSFWVQ